jgi:hypothetical protein
MFTKSRKLTLLAAMAHVALVAGCRAPVQAEKKPATRESAPGRGAASAGAAGSASGSASTEPALQESACNAGDAEACEQLGWWYRKGEHGLAQDARRGDELMALADCQAIVKLTRKRH